MTAALDAQVAIVTGAGRGFGRAIATRLAAEGASVALIARSTHELDEVAAAIRADGGRAQAFVADVTDANRVRGVCRETAEAYGDVTLLVNNAGMAGPFGPVGEVDPVHWWEAQTVNQLGPFLFASAVLGGMKTRGRGRILNINATAAVVIAPNLSAYCVSKAAQLRLTEIIDAESRGAGVRAFALQPGMAMTGMATATLHRADAQRWVPGMVERIGRLQGTAEGTRDLTRCADLCVRIASGELDALAGRYLDVNDDFDSLLAKARRETDP